jgi:hypothetical protein
MSFIGFDLLFEHATEIQILSGAAALSGGRVPKPNPTQCNCTLSILNVPELNLK